MLQSCCQQVVKEGRTHDYHFILLLLDLGHAQIVLESRFLRIDGLKRERERELGQEICRFMTAHETGLAGDLTLVIFPTTVDVRFSSSRVKKSLVLALDLLILGCFCSPHTCT